MSRLYTPEQLDFLRDNRKNLFAKELTRQFNEKFSTAKNFMAIAAVCKRYGWAATGPGKFKKGNIPFNKGKKGLNPANSGSFKKGHEHITKKPLGYRRIDKKNGYVWVKIAEPNGWRQLHVINWEAEHGPVPKGYVVRILSGDKTDCQLENLCLISCHENLKLNRNGFQQAPKELQPAILALSKMQVALSEKNREHKNG